MISQNSTNKYASLLIETKDMVNKTKKLGIDTTKIEERMTKIEKTIDDEIAKIIIQPNNPLKEGYLTAIYQDGINQLEKIQTYLLSEFDTCSKISATYQYIVTNYDNLNLETISSFTNETKKLLKQLPDLFNIDHQTKKSLTENIYLLVYQMIKKEYQILENSTLLPLLTDIDIPYIEKYLLEEIKEISSNNNPRIGNLIQKIEMEGLNPNYLQEEVFQLLVDSEFSDLEKIDKNQVPRLKKVKNEISKIQQEINEENKKLQKIIDKIEVLKKELKKQKLVLIRYYSTFALISAAGYFGLNSMTTEKAYYTTEEIYQPGEEPTIGDPYYETSSEDKVRIIQYYPYEKLGFFDKLNNADAKFFRKVKVYDVSEIEFKNLEDYIMLDLKELGIESEDEKEYKVYLTPQDTYSDIITEVKRTTHDLEKVEQIQNKEDFSIVLIGFYASEFIMFLAGFPNKYKNIKAKLNHTKDKKVLLEQNIMIEKNTLISLEDELKKLQTNYITTSSKQLIKKKQNQKKLSNKEFNFID